MRRAPLIIWTLAVITTTVAIVLLVSFRLQTYLTNDRRVVACRDAQRTLFELAIVLQDAENNARGYLLSGQSSFAERYRAAEGEMDARLAAAGSTISALQMESEFDEARSQIELRRRTLGQVMSLVERDRRSEAIELMQSGGSLENLAAIRESVVAMVRAAAERLAERLAICRSSMFSMTRWVLIGVAALVLFCALLVWLTWRENFRQRRVNVELAAARDAALAGTRAREDFLNVLSHELRTPLTPALLYLSHLERDAPEGSERRHDLTIVRRQLELEVRLIDDLLDLSRALRGEIQLKCGDVRVHVLLRHVTAALGQEIAERSTPVTLALDAANDCVLGDEPRLHQVFWHVLGNAIKFSAGSGRIAIRTGNVDGRIVVEVCDSGVGLTPEQTQSIFEPFRPADPSRTRHFGGLGVGLPIVKAIVGLHGGNVRARSDGKDSGATFTVSLPVVVPPPTT